ncbi:MAG: lytic murein transglycosylase B [Gammaproteobacteria bacterium]|nr:MAG: lytic murein transglycosylase B [Gammaproteobacteria bacterium]
MRTPSVLILLIALLLPANAAGNYAQRDDVKDFIHMMAKKHNYDSNELANWFQRAKRQEGTLKAIAKPAEGLAWYRYRKIFITEERINKGVKFWNDYETELNRAEQTYGVPAEIIVAIIGVETFYGKHAGKYPVFDTLVTLGFDYPKRGKFFRSELEQYLLLIREESLDPFSLKGSYAGAVGKPQFISSSYRNYAIDFDGDGKRDLLNNTADAIGSVANYFSRHGWKPGEAITIRAKYKGNKAFPDFGMKPKKSVSQLSSHGLFPAQPVVSSALAAPIALEQEEHKEYWFGLHNFYVITRYNHSNLYAMAVYELSQLVKQQRDQIR